MCPQLARTARKQLVDERKTLPNDLNDLNDLNEPISVSPSSPDGAAIVEFVQQVTREAGFDTALTKADGPAVVVCPRA